MLSANLDAVWAGQYWQVEDDSSSSLTIATDDVPLGSYTMDIVIYHYRSREKFIPLGYASTQFSITGEFRFLQREGGTHKFILSRMVSTFSSTSLSKQNQSTHSPQIKYPSPSRWTRSMTLWPETCASSRTERSPSPSPSMTPASTWVMQISPSTGNLGMEVELLYPGSWLSPTPTSALAPSSPRWWSRQWSQIRPATCQLIPRRPPVHPLTWVPMVKILWHKS